MRCKLSTEMEEEYIRYRVSKESKKLSVQVGRIRARNSLIKLRVENGFWPCFAWYSGGGFHQDRTCSRRKGSLGFLGRPSFFRRAYLRSSASVRWGQTRALFFFSYFTWAMR